MIDQEQPEMIATETLLREHEEELKYYRQRNLSLSHAVTKLSNERRDQIAIIAALQQQIGSLQVQVNMLNNRLASKPKLETEVLDPETGGSDVVETPHDPDDFLLLGAPVEPSNDKPRI